MRADFAYAPKAETPPSDVIDEGTWKSIVILPDDVAVRTSNYHGRTLRQLHDLWEAWIESRGGVNGSLAIAMLDAGDEFQSATYAALTGFYRLSIAALRSALELVAIGTWAEVCHKGSGISAMARRNRYPLFCYCVRRPYCRNRTIAQKASQSGRRQPF